MKKLLSIVLALMLLAGCAAPAAQSGTEKKLAEIAQLGTSPDDNYRTWYEVFVYSSRHNPSKNETEIDWLVTWNPDDENIKGIGKALVGEYFRTIKKDKFRDVFVRSEEELLSGDFIEVTITDFSEYDLIGERNHEFTE